MIGRHSFHPAAARLVLVAGVSIFVIIVYSTSFSSMWELWQTSDHRHGVLVFPISAFLIWQLRHEMSNVTLRFDGQGMLLLVVVVALWSIGRLAGVQVVEHLTVLALIPAIILTIAGREITKKIMFPLAFLILATPIGDTSTLR